MAIHEWKARGHKPGVKEAEWNVILREQAVTLREEQVVCRSEDQALPKTVRPKKRGRERERERGPI